MIHVEVNGKNNREGKLGNMISEMKNCQGWQMIVIFVHFKSNLLFMVNILNLKYFSKSL